MPLQGAPLLEGSHVDLVVGADGTFPMETGFLVQDGRVGPAADHAAKDTILVSKNTSVVATDATTGRKCLTTLGEVAKQQRAIQAEKAYRDRMDRQEARLQAERDEWQRRNNPKAWREQQWAKGVFTAC